MLWFPELKGTHCLAHTLTLAKTQLDRRTKSEDRVHKRPQQTKQVGAFLPSMVNTLSFMASVYIDSLHKVANLAASIKLLGCFVRA